MKYMGSKSRIAKDIVPIIQNYIDSNNITTYIEPFVGGGNIIDKIRCGNKIGSDIHHYLISLLKQAQTDASVFPLHISEDEYKDVKQNPDVYPEWYVGLVGFCASFSAKWFSGYARSFQSDGITPRDMSNEAIRNLIKQAPNFKGIKFQCCNFKDIIGVKNAVIYCDIPYCDTTKYLTSSFSYDEFYNWCRLNSKDNIIIVSEYNMPDDFECIWCKDIKCLIDSNKTSANGNNKRTEKLFILKHTTK